MTLNNDIKEARHEIVTDGYEMSIGELISLYQDEELIINPVFQRFFRWSLSQKTRFIESLLLGIPIPPIFVFQNDDGVWELIDGLQRLSTIYEFVGVLRTDEGNITEPSVMEGTNLLPSLSNKSWDENEELGSESIGRVNKLEIKRARMRVEILKKESEPFAKFELFQRLNTGGSHLTEQEVRNAIIIMVNEGFFHWVSDLANLDSFSETISISENAKQKQYDLELALRFIIYRNIDYKSGLDVHEYLNVATLELAQSDDFDFEREADIFERTFDILNNTMGESSFKRWDGDRFTGQFLISAYEVIAVGISKNLESIEELNDEERQEFIEEKIINIWQDETFQENSGAGVRGTKRLSNLVPLAFDYFEL
jgi:uncharacterized protein with ParB-like and HNH nuclease domain